MPTTQLIMDLQQIRSVIHILHATAAARRVSLHMWFAYQPSPRTALHLGFDQRQSARTALHLLCDDQSQARSALHLLSEAEQFLTVRRALHASYTGLKRTGRGAHLQFYGADPIAARTALHLLYTAPALRGSRSVLHLLHGSTASVFDFMQATVVINGVRVQPLSVRVVEDINQIADTAVMEFAKPLPSALSAFGIPVHITIMGISYDLIVGDHSRGRSFADRRYTLTASSPAISLQGRHAKPVHGALTGLASSLAASLCGQVTMQWRMVDWLVLPLRWQATGQAPLDLLRDLVSAAGGLLTSGRDGSLAALAWPPHPPEDWQDYADASVDTMSSIYTLDDNEDERDLYNLFIVADEMLSGDQFRIEEDRDKKQGAYTEALVYQTPWDDTFDLSHRGDIDSVVLQTLGDEERVVEEEMVEIQNGEGRTQFPIYALIRLRWNKVDLGSIKHSEDGRIETGVDGESLLFLTYKTRARRYKVYMGPGKPDPLMLVAGG